MNKELTPLEALEKIKFVLDFISSGELLREKDTMRYLGIIENALEDYERLLKMRKMAEWADEKLQTKKKLKAIEIVKAKTNLTKTREGIKALVFVILETQEEFDLLKEVLL